MFAPPKCTNCQETIVGVRVHCHICQEVFLCLQCFAAGAEMGPHKNNHAYQFMVNNILFRLDSHQNVLYFRIPLQ